MEYIKLLSDYIQNASFNYERFADIAFDALQKYPPAQHITSREILHHVFENERLPRQTRMDKDFGQPSLTLFRNKLFHIDVLFWLDGTTAIHQHNFAGAFSVLQGCSLHCTYEFEHAADISATLKIGTVKLSNVEYLETGSIRKINPGASYIHSLFHLESPSCTFIIRTPDLPSAEKEFEYIPPYLAVDPRYKLKKLKRLHSLELLIKTNIPQYKEHALDLLTTCNLHEAFLILRQARLSVKSDLYFEMTEVFRKSYSKIADVILLSIEEDWRRAIIISKRKTIEQKDLRFFLALLLNLPDKQSILYIIQQKYPAQNPLQLVGKWMRELFNANIFGASQSAASADIFDLLWNGNGAARVLEMYASKNEIDHSSHKYKEIESCIRAVTYSPILAPLLQ